MFRRENRKCFGETKNCFGVNHQAGKVSECVRNFLEGAGNVLGPSGIFPKRTRAKNTMFPQGGQDPPFRGELFLGGAPFGGQPTIGGSLLGGPHGGGSPHKWWRTCWERGPLGGSPLHGAPWTRGPPLGGKLPPFVGQCCLLRGPPFLGSHPHPFLHYKY